MLWSTTSICCGLHILWSATTFTDAGNTTPPAPKNHRQTRVWLCSCTGLFFNVLFFCTCNYYFHYFISFLNYFVLIFLILFVFLLFSDNFVFDFFVLRFFVIFFILFIVLFSTTESNM